MPTSLSVAQCHARTAELKAESAYSGVGVVADQTLRAQAVAEDAIAKARSMCKEVASKITEVVRHADVSASSMAESLEGKMREMAAHTDATTTHAVGELQSKTREFVEAHRHDLEAKSDYNQAETQRTADDTKAAVDRLSAQLAQLTT